MERSRTFLRTVFLNRNHVTTHPGEHFVIFCRLNFFSKLTFQKIISKMLSECWTIGSRRAHSCPGLGVINLFSCSTRLSTKFILLIKVKMTTIVCILTFIISVINTISERLKSKNFFICQYFIVYEQLKFCAQLYWARKKLYNPGSCSLRAWSGYRLFAKGISRWQKMSLV